MAKPRFYEPGTIKPHPRVKYKKLDVWNDQYVGQADDLIEAGVLQPHMLPPRVSLAWRPAGVQREEGGWIGRLPGYLTVTKVVERGYRVVVVVSREERAARQQEQDRKDAERHAHLKQYHEKVNAQGKAAADERDRHHRSQPEKLREQVDFVLRMLSNYVEHHVEGVEQEDSSQSQFFCRFPAEAAADALYHVRELEIWLESVEIYRLATPASPVEKARKDRAFQSFLQSQCLGSDHA